MKRICTLLLALALIFSLSATAYAKGNVKYDGDSAGFIFEPGTEQSLTSLFEDFQDVMPGDSITEQVVIRNITKGTKIKVYMRALGAIEGQEFLNQLKLKVTLPDGTVRFDAQADETAQLTNWKPLGTFKSGSETELTVTLEVPIEMGNDFQEAVGALQWEFYVEEYPNTDGPSTGDTTPLVLYGALAGICAFGLILLLFKRKKNSEA